jgi:DNA invertase Pin-like site-specific DNA recombinase
MLSDIRAGKVDAVIVWHEDRLTRLPASWRSSPTPA